MTRGPEQGRSPEEILREAKILAEQGAKEITLLGQTVNSYRWVDGQRTTRLADLLQMLHPIEGIERIKFVTSYPKDMTRELLETVRDLPKCMPYLHVPAQSAHAGAVASSFHHTRSAAPRIIPAKPSMRFVL
jgi:tRNA-2-methylthio-N6-dimethylallyladenosine synthase